MDMKKFTWCFASCDILQYIYRRYFLVHLAKLPGKNSNLDVQYLCQWKIGRYMGDFFSLYFLWNNLAAEQILQNIWQQNRVNFGLAEESWCILMWHNLAAASHRVEQVFGRTGSLGALELCKIHFPNYTLWISNHWDSKFPWNGYPWWEGSNP